MATGFRNVLACLLLLVGPMAWAQVDLDAFLKADRYGQIKLSPGGDYFAAEIPVEDRTVLAIIRRADKAFTAKVEGGKRSRIGDFWWASDTRVVVAMAERFGSMDQPFLTGELHAVDVDGKRGRMLIGHDGPRHGEGQQVGGALEAATMVDPLPGDAEHVLISTQPFSANPQTQVERLNIFSKRRAVIARAPVRRAVFVTDSAGRVRFAQGAGSDNVSKLHYRDHDEDPWRLLNDAAQSGRVETPIGFSADGATAYLQVEHAQGPDSLVAITVQTGERIELLRDDTVDPWRILYAEDGKVPVGAAFMREGVTLRFFDEAGPDARLFRSLERAMPGHAIAIASRSHDGRFNLVQAWNDRNPGDFYLFDAVEKGADRVFSRRDWLDPGRMAAARSIRLDARDGLTLHGYLTMPVGSDGRNLPMVVLPHGGPFAVFDEWGFDPEVQILAQAGYAVLRVNFRGSGNYGRAFMQAGARQWGRAMQDDLTDATRWAIAEGIADPARICLYGASYGGYAALMGAAREPELYRCAAGYVGAYDLPTLHADDASTADWLRTWADEWLGDPHALAEVSPTRIATRIKAPVFLAAGGQDQRVPAKHHRLMEKALRDAGTPVETLYYPTEGHGFHELTHQREFYTRLLDFLGRHIGAGKAKPLAGEKAG